MKRSIYIGFDPRESAAFAIARDTIRRHLVKPIPVHGLVQSDLRRRGLYTRRETVRHGQRWCEISEAPMSTEFANSRFLVPHLAGRGLALFIDCDFMALGNIDPIFDEYDPKYAVMCVKHDHRPTDMIKMDGQTQTVYSRKNWSSCVVFNCDHPANRRLTLDMVNTLPGRDLHRFCWLEDDEIGGLDPKWNYLVGHTDKSVRPVFVHHTDGIPMMSGYEDAEYADEWWMALEQWAE